MKPGRDSSSFRLFICLWLLLSSLQPVASRADHAPTGLQASPDAYGHASLMAKVREKFPEASWHQFSEFQATLWQEFPELCLLYLHGSITHSPDPNTSPIRLLDVLDELVKNHQERLGPYIW